MTFPSRISPQRRLWLGTFAAIAVQLGYAALSADRELFSIFRDDAFYYFVIARNIVTTGVSSFDGVVPTNGYHPLWLVVLLPFVEVFRGRALLFAVLIAGAASACTSLWLLQRLTPLLLAPRSRGEAAPLDDGLAIAEATAMVFVMQLAFLGMESVLAVPALLVVGLLFFRLLDEEVPSFGAALKLGLGLSVVCLARLDATLLGFIAGALVVWRERRRPAAALRAVAGMAVGVVPFVAYLAFNRVHYGHLMTTSALAKNLAPGLRFNTVILSFLLMPPIGPFVLLSLVGAAFVARRGVWPSDAARSTALALNAFAFGYFATLTLSSTWQIWRWYLYPLVPCVALGAGLGVRWLRERYERVTGWLPLGARLAAWALPFTVLATSLGARGSIAAGIYESAARIAAFEAQHPGRYAMGDAAGMAGFLMRRPPFQLEGLVADYSFLEHMRRRDDLVSVLREYDIDYLIDRGPDDRVDGCGQVSVPNARQAGSASPKMTGRFCGGIDLAKNLRVFELKPR